MYLFTTEALGWGILGQEHSKGEWGPSLPGRSPSCVPPRESGDDPVGECLGSNPVSMSAVISFVVCLKVLLVFLLFVFQGGIKMEMCGGELAVPCFLLLSLHPLPLLVSHNMDSILLAAQMSPSGAVAPVSVPLTLWPRPRSWRGVNPQTALALISLQRPALFLLCPFPEWPSVTQL